MKDQASVGEETPAIKYDRALSLFTESVMKPDHDLRGCAHNQDCYDELMEIREDVLKYLKTLKEVTHHTNADESDEIETEKLIETKEFILRRSIGKAKYQTHHLKVTYKCMVMSTHLYQKRKCHNGLAILT